MDLAISSAAASKSATMLVLPLLILLLHLLPSSAALAFANESKVASVRMVPAILAFGDSIIDPGNNNDMDTLVKSNFAPYGIDFPNHKSTGRFSNGKIVSDIIASRLGVKEYLPAYVNNELKPEELLTGVSFASGGTGFDPMTAKIQRVLSMDDQIDLFKDYVAKLHTIADDDRVNEIISKSLFLVCVGNDDIANTYYGTPFRVTDFDIDSYIDFMIENAAQFVEKLVLNGAKQIGFVGLPPIGCLPSQRTLAGGLLRKCDSKRNSAAQMFNSKMPKALRKVQNKYHGSNIVFMGIFDIMIDIIENPEKYGFEETRKGCCGTGLIEVSILCNSRITAKLCDDPSKYMFWDSYHPTERGYQIITEAMLKTHLHDLN